MGFYPLIFKRIWIWALQPLRLYAVRLFSGLWSFGAWACFIGVSFGRLLSTLLMLLGGGALSGLTGVFYYQSLQELPASYAIILLFQFTWIGLLVDWVWRKRRPGIWRWTALVCILGGTALAAGLKDGQPISVTGIILGVVGIDLNFTVLTQRTCRTPSSRYCSQYLDDYRRLFRLCSDLHPTFFNGWITGARYVEMGKCHGTVWNGAARVFIC